MTEEFLEEGWAKECLSNSKYKITIPAVYVDMISDTGQLLVKTGWAFEPGDIIRVTGIEATIIDRKAAWEYPRHTFILTIECEQAEELKEKLTYRLEDK